MCYVLQRPAAMAKGEVKARLASLCSALQIAVAYVMARDVMPMCELPA